MSDAMEEHSPAGWMDYMQRGDFEAAWKHSDAVLKARTGTCWHLPRHFQSIWNGGSISGKRVLIRCYHGLGDTIQFIRYAPLLKAAAASVIVWAQPSLIPLLQTIPSIDQLLPLHDGSPEAAFDMDVEIMELPHIFRTTLATIPATVPYLHVEPAPLPAAGDQLSVGLVWKAGDWDERRSVPFSLLATLAAVPGTRFCILQYDADKAGWDGSFGVYAGNLSLFDYARAVRSLDLLISVDSMPAHLAGALGVPVWNLLHSQADWRWLQHRSDSPWYPTMRLFRQQVPGKWEGVVMQVREALEKFRTHISTPASSPAV